jgi:hypothetical protein
LTFSLAITQLRLQRGCNSLKVATKSIGETLELRHSALFSRGKPWAERRVVPLADELAELQSKSLE